MSNATENANSDLTTGNGIQSGGGSQNQPLLEQPSSPQLPQYYPYQPALPYPSPYQSPLNPTPYPYPYPSQPYPTNQPPIANAGPDQVVNQGVFVRLDGTGSYDPDGGTITSYLWQQTGGNPIVALSGANTATPTFTAPIVPSTTAISLTFRLTVRDSDGGASSSSTVNVVIQKNTQPPIANAGSDQTVNQMSLVELNGTGSYDPNNEIIVAYSWVQTAGIPVILNGANTATPTFTAPIVPSTTDTIVLSFGLRVMNNSGIFSNNPAIVLIAVKPIR
jgi:hypothetical protein